MLDLDHIDRHPTNNKYIYTKLGIKKKLRRCRQLRHLDAASRNQLLSSTDRYGEPIAVYDWQWDYYHFFTPEGQRPKQHQIFSNEIQHVQSVSCITCDKVLDYEKKHIQGMDIPGYRDPYHISLHTRNIRSAPNVCYQCHHDYYKFTKRKLVTDLFPSEIPDSALEGVFVMFLIDRIKKEAAKQKKAGSNG